MNTTVPADRDVVVRVRGFTKYYGARPAAVDVDLEVLAGEIYGLIGPDGAGKSTLLKAIAGVLAHDAGRVEVCGTVLGSERSAEAVKGRLGFMPQGLGLSLYPELSVEENVDFFAELRGVPAQGLSARKQRLLALTRLDMFRDRAMKHLSGGMKQKLALVCTLIHEPELVILDEPTTGVDPLSRRDFWAILAELVREHGLSVLISTAYLDEASRCDRVALMHQGRRLAEGDPELLRRACEGSVVRIESIDRDTAMDALERAGLLSELSGGSIRVFVPRADAERARSVVRAALALPDEVSLGAQEPELEDVFLVLVRDSESSRESRGKLGVVERTGPVQATPGGSREPAIEAATLSRSFGGFRAVQNVTFRVEYGEIFGLLGENGAGKTTVIKMLTGILTPSSGDGRVAGTDMRRPEPAARHRIGYMSQAFSLYADLTVLENIHFYAGVYGLTRAEARRRSTWIVELAGLEAHLNDLAASLPMGLRQRLALGCALVHRPKVLFLDEPTSGVDPGGRRRFWQILFQLARYEGVAVLITTHALAEAEHCDRVALMHAGLLVADASPSQLKRAMKEEVGEVVELGAHPQSLALKALQKLGHREAAAFGRRVHVFCRDPQHELGALSGQLRDAGVTLDTAAVRPLTLEHVFVHRIGSLERKAGRS